MGHKKFWKSFQIECEKFKNYEHDNLKLQEEAHNIWLRSPRSRTQSYEIGGN